MATSKVQRWGIMTILIVTVVGTLGSFAVMVLSMQNQQRIQADYEKVNNEYQTQLKAYKAKVQAQADELSAKYYDTFKQYSTQAGTYDVNSVKELKTEDLAEGDGVVIDGSTKFAAYYIGCAGRPRRRSRLAARTPSGFSWLHDPCACVAGGSFSLLNGGSRESPLPSCL